MGKLASEHDKCIGGPGSNAEKICSVWFYKIEKSPWIFVRIGLFVWLFFIAAQRKT